MKTIGYLKNALMIAVGGSQKDAMNTIQPFIDKFGPIASQAVHIVSLFMTVAFVVKGVINFAQSKNATNPNEQKQKTDEVKNAAWGAAISLCLGIIVNAVLGMLGVDIWQVIL